MESIIFFFLSTSIKTVNQRCHVLPVHLVQQLPKLLNQQKSDRVSRSLFKSGIQSFVTMCDEIEELKNKIRDHELELLTVNDSGERIAIREQISACRKDITALRQQGESHHTFPLSFPNRLDVILCPIYFDISSSPIQVRQRRKVKGDEPSWNVGF